MNQPATIDFWGEVNRQLDQIITDKPTTFDAVKAILDSSPLLNDYAGVRTADQTFFAGGGGDESLRDALEAADWRVTWSQQWYYYVIIGPGPGFEAITYIEGDVMRGDTVRGR